MPQWSKAKGYILVINSDIPEKYKFKKSDLWDTDHTILQIIDCFWVFSWEGQSLRTLPACHTAGDVVSESYHLSFARDARTCY